MCRQVRSITYHVHGFDGGILRVYITTDGCEVAGLKSTQIQQFLTQNSSDIKIVTNIEEADLVVFYACGLTNTAEQQALRLLRKMRSQMKPNARIVVWGCLSKVNPKSLAPVYDGPTLGPNDTDYFESILKDISHPYDEVYANTLISSLPWNYEDHSDFSSRILWNIRYTLESELLARLGLLKLTTTELKDPVFFLRVAEGCASNCTYCSERLVWGRIRSQPIKKIISEFKLGLQKGYKRFFLCAEDLGAYGVDIGHSACDLLKKIVNLDTDKEYKIIINEMSPPYLKTAFSDFREIFASGRVESVGCQVESGSVRILKLMGRHYKAEEWREVMLRINAEFPHIRLTTHFMVGFPTETAEDFEATLKLLNYPLFLNEIAIFKFSPRPGVPASLLKGQIPETTKESRYRKLNRKFLYINLLNIVTRNILAR